VTEQYVQPEDNDIIIIIIVVLPLDVQQLQFWRAALYIFSTHIRALKQILRLILDFRREVHEKCPVLGN